MTERRQSFVNLVDLGLVDEPFSPADLLQRQKRNASAALGPGLVDIGRLLLLVEANKIVEKREILSSIRRAPSVHSILVIAVGPTATGLTLEVPAGFGTDLPVIWVPDDAGAEWAPNDPSSAVVVVGEGEGQLDSLIAALSLPEVFDAVAEPLRAGRWQAVTVGLETLAVGRRDEVGVHLAELEITAVLGSEDTKAGVLAGSLIEGGVIPRLHPRPRLETLLEKEGRLSAAFEQVGSAIAEAESLHEDLVTARAPWAFSRTELEHSTEQIATGIEQLRSVLEQGFSSVDVRDGLSPSESEAVRNLGIDAEVAAEIERSSPDEVIRALWSEVRGDIDRIRPLEAIAQRVDAVAQEAPPRTARESVEVLNLALPDDYAASYRQAMIPSINLREPIGVALFAVGAFLASVWEWRVGWVMPIALLLSLVAAIAIGVTQGQTRDGRRRFGFPVEVVDGWWPLGAIAVGVGGGVALGFSLNVNHLISVGLTLLSVGPFYMAIRREWTRWRGTYIDGLGLPELKQQINSAEETAASVIHDDWLLFKQRLRIEQFALNLSAALRSVIEQLHGANDSAASSPSLSESRLSEGIRAAVAYPSLAKVIGADYAFLITNVIEQNWAHVIAGRVGQVRRAVAESCQRALGRYREHLSSQGVLVPPTLFDLTGPLSARGDLIESLWQAAANDAEQILQRKATDPLVQLADPQHLRLLDSDEGSRFQVWFAPEAAQQALRVWKGGTAGRVTTEAKHLVGTLRLVRLRPGTVVEQEAESTSGAPKDLDAESVK